MAPMSWYYAEAGGRVGPVSEDEFQALVASGRISPETLVWKQGLPEWVAYGDYVQATGAGRLPTGRGGFTNLAVESAVCTECERHFPLSELADFSGRKICASCKPIYIQKLREGLAIDGLFTYTGFWWRVLAKIIDGIFQQIVLTLFNMLAGFTVGKMIGSEKLAIILALVGMVITLAMNTFFIGRFATTPGKAALKMKIVRPDGSPVTYARALGRNLAEFLSGALLGIGYLIAAFDPQRRTLHDRIAGTVVIKK